MIEVPLDYIEANGKKWIFIQSSLSLQCAYCLSMQLLNPIRNDTGLVVKLKVMDEAHNNSCPQDKEQVGKAVFDDV